MWRLMLAPMVLALFTLFGGQTAFAQIIDSNYRDGVVYVKVRDTSALELVPYNNSDVALNLIMQQHGVDSITRPFPDLNAALDKTYCFYFRNHSQVNTFINALAALPAIEYAEKVRIYTSLSAPFTPNDIQAQQYYLDKIFARDAWGVSQGNPNIVVAIVDNGVRTAHEDIAPVLWQNPTPNSGILDPYPNDVNGWDVADKDNNPNPPSGTTDASAFGHGTLCAGLAGAKTNNGIGMASIGFNIRIMPVKCTSDGSNGSTLSHSYDGVYYAIQAGADVISMSWGATDNSITGQNLMNSATDKGIILVAAAGNSNTSTPYYPAAYNNVIAVAATDANDVKASYSNFGNWVDVSAPGNGLYTTLAGSNTSYGTASGTSVATPLVAGLAALILSNEPNLTPAQVKQRLQQSSDNIDGANPSFVGQLGTGRINAAKALGTTPTNPTGIEGTNSSATAHLGVKLYPNPGKGVVYISAGNAIITQLTLFDVAGRSIKTITPGGPTSSMVIVPDVEVLPGFYFWKVTTTEGTVARSWIKQ